MAGSIHSAVLPFCVPRYSWLKDIWVVSIWSCHEYCALNIHAQVVTSIVVFFCLFIYLFTDWLMQHVYCAVYVWYMCAIMCACIYGYACMCVCWPRACIRCLPLMSLQNFVFSFCGRLSLYAWNSSTGELGYHWALMGFCLLPLCAGVTCGPPCLVKNYFRFVCLFCAYVFFLYVNQTGVWCSRG